MSQHDKFMPSVSTYSRSTPFLAKIKKRECLTKPESTKSTYHIVLDLAGGAVDFLPGDSIAVLPKNDPFWVNRCLKALKVAPKTPVFDKRKNETVSIEELLLHRVDLFRLTPTILKFFRAESGDNLVQLAERHPLAAFTLQELVSLLLPLLPRFYSVASSSRLHPDEVHLTVALVSIPTGDEMRFGIAGHFLCHLAEVETTPIPMYVLQAPHFRLPQEGETPIIMIGPGTGIAPFRAFLQERAHLSNNWLFFGERHRTTDYLYEEFLEELAQAGKLKLDLAFSRDTPSKTYVQHLMLEKADELREWINRGAHIYISGDASRMARDVQSTLEQILSLHHSSPKSLLLEMKRSRRLSLDVY